VSLFWSLTRKRTGIKRTDDLLNTIARHAIQTGLLTVTFAALDVGLFVALPDNTISFFFDFGLPKLYSNSLVSSLNARSRRRGEDIIELGFPATNSNSAMFTGSTVRSRHTVSDPVALVKSAVNHTSDDILALDTGNEGLFPDPK